MSEEETFDENSKMARFKRFIAECGRVLRITKKPDRIEFTTIVKVSALGILSIGLLGFTIQMMKIYLFQ
jgi:protein transport protein SEC61 subunit gamma and related proteins